MSKQIKIIFIVFFLTINLFATDWYVKNGGTGSNNGTSWTNAWTSFSSINWSSVNAGDYIYIDGGTTSVTYTTGINIGKSGSTGNYIYIMAGKYAPDATNHSGRPTITTSGYALTNQSYDWIYVKGLAAIDCTSDRVFNFHTGADHLVFDSLYVYNNRGVGMWSENTSYVEIKNCTIISHTNSSTYDNDCIQSQYSGNHHWFVHHNYLRMRNLQTADGHYDNLQLQNDAKSIFIYNNICIVDSANQGHNFILGVRSATSNADTVLYFNNYMMNGGYSTSSSFSYWADNIFNRSSEYGEQYYPVEYVINNTLVSKNAGIFTIRDENRPSMACNNIMLKLGQNGNYPTGKEPGTHINLNGEYVDSMKTNLFYQKWDGDASFGGSLHEGSPGDWSGWQSLGGDGVNADPKMKYYQKHNPGATEQPYEIDATSPAIGAGTDMRYILKKFTYLPGFDYTKDIVGNTIDWSDPDIGCYQYGAAAPPSEVKKVRVIIIQ